MRTPGAVKEESAPDIATVVNGGGVAGGAGQQALKKGPWTVAEDAILIEYVKKNGEGNWNAVQKNSGLQRCGKSCRLRWANHLRPNLKKGSFSPQEEILILRLHAQLGNKWARMAAQLPGRTDNEIKNYWNTRIKRRQRAGLPLYPPEIQHQMATINLMHGPATSGINPPLLAQMPQAPSSAPVSSSSLSLFNSASLSPAPAPMPLYSTNPFGENNISFQLPLIPVSQTAAALFPNTLSTVSAAVASQQFQYGLGNFELSPPPPPLHSPSYSVKMELPSSQLFPESAGEQLSLGQGNSGLLDALLQESHDVVDLVKEGLLLEQLPIISPGGGAGDPLSKFEESDFSNGIQVKSDSSESVPTAMATVNNDIYTLLDMIPSHSASSSSALPDWCKKCDSAGEFSNGPSSVVTDDDLRLEMQHLASTLSPAPVDHDWGLGSCSWDNMPSIC